MGEGEGALEGDSDGSDGDESFGRDAEDAQGRYDAGSEHVDVDPQPPLDQAVASPGGGLVVDEALYVFLEVLEALFGAPEDG